MTFSQYAGIAIVPTLSRIVLCVAFVSAGYNKVFKQADYSAEEAALLKTMGVEVMAQQMAFGERPDGWVVRPAAFIQEEPPSTQPEAEPDEPSESEDIGNQEPPAQPERPAQPRTREPERPRLVPPTRAATRPATRPAEDPTPTPADSAPTAATATAPPTATGSASGGGTYRAAGMYKIAVMLDKAGWPQPKIMTWLAAYTELVGGALLGLGLFSRIWGLGLSIAMGVAFYMVSVSMNGIFNQHPFTFAENIMAFNTAYCQLGLGLLAFGIFLTGPGPLSLDRLLFGGPKVEVSEVPIT